MTFDQTKEAFETLFRGEMSESDAKALLVEMYERGESATEIAAAAEVMRAFSVKLPISEDLKEKLIDNCGTGGDKSHSFNISTTVSLVLAACGCYVAKHGNRSITSKSGSADMLESLGINLNLSVESQVKMLEETGFAFMFAQNHHPAMKYIMPIRKSLSHRTIFNILGPLSNPVEVKKQLIGVFSPEYVSRIANALVMLDSKRAVVVSSLDGMDEISIESNTKAAFYDGVRVKESVIEPTMYGLEGKKSDLIGGEAKENASITMKILEGEEGSRKNVVLLNAAAALWADGKVENLSDGIAMANEALVSKKALEKVKKIIEVSQKLS